MPRVALDLNKTEDRRQVKSEWRVAAGLVPGAPNEGLTAQLVSTPARLAWATGSTRRARQAPTGAWCGGR